MAEVVGPCGHMWVGPGLGWGGGVGEGKVKIAVIYIFAGKGYNFFWNLDLHICANSAIIGSSLKRSGKN